MVSVLLWKWGAWCTATTSQGAPTLLQLFKRYISQEQYICKKRFAKFYLSPNHPIFAPSILFERSQSECFLLNLVPMQISLTVNGTGGLATQPKTSKQTKLWKVYLHLLHFLLTGFWKEKSNIISGLSNRNSSEKNICQGLLTTVLLLWLFFILQLQKS